MSLDSPYDSPMTPEERARVELLDSSGLEKIDEALLSNMAYQWRKTARVIGATMMEMVHAQSIGIPDVFYAQRINSLVDKGLVVVQGDTRKLRYSEIRLPPLDQ